MKIFIVVHDLRLGGAERMMVKIANWLSGHHEVFLVCLAKKQEFEVFEIDTRIHVLALGAAKVRLSFFRLFNSVRRGKPDVMLSALPHTNFVCALVGWILNTPTVLSERNNPFLDDSGFKYLSLYYSYLLAHSVICISQGVAEGLSRLPIKRFDPETVVIYNPAYSGKYLQKKYLGQIFKIVAVGRLVPQKDFPTLIKAIKILKNEYNSIHLTIFGSGSQRNELLNLINRLELETNIDIAEGIVTTELLHRYDIFVSSSKWEGFGNVIVEAMSADLQIVCTDCDYGPREILDQGRWGRLCRPGDPVDLAEKIVATIRNPVANNYLPHLRKFSIEEIGVKYESHLLRAAVGIKN